MLHLRGIRGLKRNFWSFSKPATETPVLTGSGSLNNTGSTSLGSNNSALGNTLANNNTALESISNTSLGNSINNTALNTSIKATPLKEPTVFDPSSLPNGTDLTSPTLDAITALGDLKALGLCNSTPVGLVERLMELIYVSTGLPWWATIALGTVSLRLVLFPFILKSQRGMAKMHNIKPIVEPIQNEMMRLKKLGDQPGAMVQAQKLRGVFAEHQVSPLTGLWGMVQAPVMISTFFALRSMAEANVPGFQTQGILWFTDLTLADPTYCLPIVASLSVLASIEVHSLI